ncbi:chromatin associated protein with a chromodomain at the C-terminus [Cryptosporidium sp. chipmunk genotype I]|uniref:chromatin associated protein with a chromodomain at the C-terminus n=1 Tax=Cryptosporidium sp. chipmunk genotype I TaxID=1280935 RepID=UPI00351A2DFA|nr:chromatin associated protein with a chromodomain at the C-terminus [Cryptosporidium sp. chipmunk genotype I]
MTIMSGDLSEGTCSEGTQKGRKGRPRGHGNQVKQIGNLDSEGNSMNDIPVERNGVISVCDIELLTEEDKVIPDSKLASYNIEEEYVGFGVGLSAGFDRYSQSNGFSSAGGNMGIRLCYSGLWRKLPQHIPVRELAMSRYHIAVLLNNGHVYVSLNDMNESLYGNLENYQKTSGVLVNSQQERPESGNEQRNSINSSNTLLLENSVVQGSWLSIKELDDKNIRGLRITSLAVEAGNFDYKFGIKSFVLACLANDGKIWIIEHSSSIQGGFNNIRHIDLTQLNPKNHDASQSKRQADNEFYRAVDVTLSEITPMYKRGFEKRDKAEEFNEYQDVMFDDFPSFPYRYGMAITSLLANGHSNSIILKKSSEIGNNNKMIVLDLPVICRKVFCGSNADFGLILLQNGMLWSWDRRQVQTGQLKQSYDPKSCISIREPEKQGEEHFSSKINLKVLKGSLSGRKVIDFSGLHGEFIALTQDGFIHEWNDPDRMSLFKRPLIQSPLILAPKTHHLIVKKAFSNSRYWSFDSIASKCCQNSDIQEPTTENEAEKGVADNNDLEEMMEKEIGEMYNPNNRIIGAWLLEGITLILYKDGVLKALYNYLGRDGYDTKVGFISEEDELCWNKQNSSVNSCILLSSRLGRCIPANPIALVGLLSNFGQCKSLSDRQKQLIIQRSLVKLSLREKPVYRILACYNSIVFGVLRSNAKWRPVRGYSSKSQATKRICKSDLSSQEHCKPSNDEEMNFSATVNLNNIKEIIKTQENNGELDPETPACSNNLDVVKSNTNQELSTLEIPSNENIQTIPMNKVDTNDQNQVQNKSRGSGSRKPSRKSSGFVKVIAASQAPEDATLSGSSPNTDSAIISISNATNNVMTTMVSTMNESPSLFENESKTNVQANKTNPASCKLSKDTNPENKNGLESSCLSSSAPPNSNKRSSISSQKACNNTSSKPHVNSRTRKRERRSLTKSEDKENTNNSNNLDHKNLYYNEKEKGYSSWESKKLSLVEYEVEQILSIREKPLTKQKEYLIKWKVPGHPVQPTWEPEENLNGCEELLQEFLKSIKTSRSGRILLPCTAINKIV